MTAKPTILVAPLDWGLGHATRCIPLIRQLLQQGCNVLLAADGPQAVVLQEAFPALPMLQLQGYGVQYSRKAVMWKVLSQVPAIVRAISLEHQWLQTVVKKHKIDLVISDNRYGLWSPHCKSILITHQLALPTPKGWGWTAGLLRKMLYKQIEQFTECWVPDIADSHASLSAALGHPTILPKLPVHYMGWLTRFEPSTIASPAFAHKLIIILSGPEPQRTLLEQLVLAQLPFVKDAVLVVRGLPGATHLPDVPAHVTVVNHLPGEALQKAMEQAEYVVARGGYSTLMDAFTLRKKCIFVPTPGQIEQEYLCQKLQEHQAAICFSQAAFSLPEALLQAENFSFQLPSSTGAGGLANFVPTALQRLLN
ncbi:MAG TPA: glycosyltransferase [Phnomibacter sp.]|nr:glycosyltransferase [Phnomibacter sp.]